MRLSASKVRVSNVLRSSGRASSRISPRKQNSGLRFPPQRFLLAAGLEHSNAHLADSYHLAESFGLRVEGRMS